MILLDSGLLVIITTPFNSPSLEKEGAGGGRIISYVLAQKTVEFFLNLK